MKRAEQVRRHNRNLKDAFEAAKWGEVINLSALIGGAEEILVDDLEQKQERAAPYSDGWKVEQ